MQCNILKNLYVKSNGDIRCDDDYGERILLGSINQLDNCSADALFTHPNYQTIRQRYQSNLAPWPGVCEQCAFYRSGVIEDSISRKVITKIQLELSLLCSLRCPACSRSEQIKAGRKPLIMSSASLKRFLIKLNEGGYSVERFELCGQGEPLNHPEPSHLIRLINEIFPASQVCLVTNGNFEVDKELTDCRLDEIIVAADGATQASYQQYRVNGDLSTCIEFFRDARALFPHAKIIWKYVLFAHNDSDEELILAQQLADSLHLNELRFINTTYGPVSDRFTVSNTKPLPICSDIVTVFPHANAFNTVKILITHAQSRQWLQKLMARLGPKFVKKLWPSSYHAIEKVTLVKLQQSYYLCADGWVASSRDASISYLGQSRQIQRIFSRRHIHWWQTLLRVAGVKVKPKYQLTKFRESLPINSDVLPNDFELIMTTKSWFYRSRFRYRCSMQ
ncbi:radical SAM protein [Neiella marina]|uniref:Radical SAM protein n=1 Tax=Neiella holothuriorum TaxID=2870530 RepID=A0ABS7EJK6_9GAMM|nr:radical SAM protein [Neiella holothuriorum]MBW8192542.1 radical SAM protein [Neiella holothuriorum]